MAKAKSIYSGGHGVMLGLLAFVAAVVVLRKQAESGGETPLGQLPG